MQKNYSVNEIRDIVQGEVSYSPEGASLDGRFLTNINTIDNSSDSELAFVTNPKYLKNFAQTKARAVLMARDIFGKLAKNELDAIGKTVVTVKNSQAALGKLLALKERKSKGPGISERAVFSKTAVLGKNVYLGANCVVEDNVKIGDGSVIYPGVFIGENSVVGRDCLIYPNAVIREDVEIGDRVIIHGGAVIGADGFGFSTDKTGHTKIPQLGKVVLEDDVEVGANTTIDRATIGETRVGAGTKIDNLAHIAHNVKIGRNCLIVAQVGISGSARIGDNVTLAGQSGVAGHITIEDNVIVGAKAGVICDIEKNSIVSGFPARPHKTTMKIIAATHKLPDLIKKLEKGNNNID